VHLFLDICQGLGLAAAAGLRPFFPAIVAGLFASANWGVDFEATSYSFLESPVWIGCVAALMILTFVLRRMGDEGPTDAAIGGIGIGLGGLLFAATLADHGHDALGWSILGLLGGGAVAAVGQGVYRNLVARTAKRLDSQAQAALPLWFDAVALVLTALSIAIPPISLVVIPFLLWLLAGGRRREGGRFAGLRILR
jgi:hypothetical protein